MRAGINQISGYSQPTRPWCQRKTEIRPAAWLAARVHPVSLRSFPVARFAGASPTQCDRLAHFLSTFNLQYRLTFDTFFHAYARFFHAGSCFFPVPFRYTYINYEIQSLCKANFLICFNFSVIRKYFTKHACMR